MKTTRFSMHGASRLRQVRGWCGILLMVFSLLGGYRATNRVTEEASSAATSEAAEYAHRLAEGGQRTPGSRALSRLERPAVPRVAGAAAFRIGEYDRLGSVSVCGHELSNGLCAPQRC